MWGGSPELPYWNRAEVVVPGRNSGAEDGIAVSSDEVMMFACSGDNFHHGVGLADIAGAGWFLQTTCHR